MTNIIDGKTVAANIAEELSQEIKNLERKPCLAVIIVGDDPASKIYVNNKKKKAVSLGLESVVIQLPEIVSEDELLEQIKKLNADVSINAILVQLPLPAHINSTKVINTISPQKDVDCFHPCNVGKISSNESTDLFPCTPRGIIRLLDEYKIPLEGANIVVVGRSNIVGRPLSQMFINRNATVTVCHSKTKNLGEITKTADILVSAVGKEKIITANMVKSGAVVIDVGINRNVDGKLAGDVDFENVKEIASFITPVPGGVGPMTIISLMQNTVLLYKKQNVI